MTQESHPLILYTATTPNGQKVTIALEELKAIGAIPGYEVKAMSFAINEQKEEWFLKINPNGRIPALTDRSRNDFHVFETASILLYLDQHYDKEKVFGFKDVDEHSDMLSWMFFMHGGLGPMQGQANHFNRYAPEDITYAKLRYTTETKRLYGVFNTRLAERDYLVGKGRGKYSWADMSVAPWVRAHAWSGVESLDDFPALKAWLEKVLDRPAVKAGFRVPTEDKIVEIASNPELAKAQADKASAWIMDNFKKDLQK